jgi:putative acetyltransferase
MSMQYELEAAHAGHFGELARVWEASVAATHDFLKAEDFELFKNLVPRFFEAVQIVHAKDKDGRIAGFLGTSDDKVEMLFIHPDYRGRGAGRVLLRYAIDELGMRKVDVNEQNEQAVGFYQHMGFRTVERRALDGMGKPYPLLCMELSAKPAEAAGAETAAQ